VHPTRLINFLVGVRGKTKETMAIGGPWSPSLDGPNPDKDPSVLIKTAIRTCKALTGVDLSSCTQWYVKNAPLLHFSLQPTLEDNPAYPIVLLGTLAIEFVSVHFPEGAFILFKNCFLPKFCNFYFDFKKFEFIT
jgi:DBC1